VTLPVPILNVDVAVSAWAAPHSSVTAIPSTKEYAVMDITMPLWQM